MTCTGCTAPTATGIYLCKRCTAELHNTIREIPDLQQELANNVAKLNNHGQQGGSPGFQTTAPADLNTLEIGYHMRQLLRSWALNLRDYDRRPHQPHCKTATQYLYAGIPEIRRHDWAGDIYRELTQICRKAHRAIDAPKEVRILGNCQRRIGLPQRCGHQLKATDDQTTITCRGCGTEYSIASLEEWNRKRARGELMTGPQAKRWLSKHTGVEIPYNTIRTWVNRRQVPYVLATVNTTDKAVKLVYPGDIMQQHHAGQ